jgi:parallel beta-helix repeat protein
VVDQLYRGDHLTLTGALKAAEPGDRILVRPGLYKEGIVINKPLEIIGDGELSEVIIEANGRDAIIVAANMARVVNLTLRQRGTGGWWGIDIGRGCVEIEGCDISGESFGCIKIYDGADPRLRRNRIHNGGRAGVFVSSGGRGTLEDNEIFSNAGSGVVIRGGNSTLRHNRIYGSELHGVLISENGRGLLEHNEITSNTGAGVAIAKGGNATLRHNRISQNERQAILVYDSGWGIFEDNDLHGNTGGAWDIAQDCEPHVTRNRNQE